MPDIIVAIGLVLAVEGLLYAAFPGGMRRMVMSITEIPDSALRTMGLVAAVAGVFLVWLVRG
jgi:uncharacterized protein YjeT (DUF2065 family)